MHNLQAHKIATARLKTARTTQHVRSARLTARSLVCVTAFTPVC
jgi:hypothetical protein